ncbi:MAG: dihydrofolate reductase family protein [Anaerolineae bacterium]|nr:dihydrofolate reductase family protein [Anaerolineae bacterium]
MRKLVVTEFMSLDGVIEAPMWTFKYWNDEIANFKGEETSNSDAMLLGRVTYEGFAAAWPKSTDQGAPYFNNVRKYVVSKTLEKAEWNNSVLIKDNFLDEIAKLKQQEGTNITVHGSTMLAQTLIQNGLVDSLRLLVYPVVLGEGKRFFDDGMKATFNLAKAQAFSSGVVALIYEPAR